MAIIYLKGDATRPSGTGNKLIVHVCNDVGGWGKGFVLALSKRWKEPEARFRQWYRSGEHFQLGEAQFVQVEADTWVGNMIGQHGLGTDANGNPPIRYEAIAAALDKAGDFALEIGAGIHMPRIGCGLAGGTWDRIEPLIVRGMVDKGVSVTVYDF